MPLPRLIVHEQILRLGLPGLAGVLLLIACSVYWVAGLGPGQQAVAELQARVERAQLRQQRIASGLEPAPPVAPRNQLETFHRDLPEQLEATTAIDRIYALAGRERITLAHGTYTLGVDKRSKLASYRIVLPVSGSYPQLRRFLQALLDEVPGLVLEDAGLQRRQIGDSQLTGQLRMTLYLSRGGHAESA